MLEYSSLLLLPWTSNPQGHAHSSMPDRRPILDPETGQALGFAGRRASRLPWGFKWLARLTLEIRETPDDSLLFILLGPGLTMRAWEVFDAEEYPVGSLRGGFIRDRYARVLAIAEPTLDGAFRYRSWEGIELGSLHRSGNENQLIFAEDLVGDPFARMLLLAASLAVTHKEH
jgi:hypothetical protein